jgi:molybdopterin molybdotransferase
MQAFVEAMTAADLIITIGGVSAGERDYFPDAFAANRIEMHLQGAAIQPGRPIAIGRASAGQVVIALPGNPVSALACACLFVWPIIRAMMGVPVEVPWQTVQLANSVKPNDRRRAFRPAIMQCDRSVIVPDWAGSGDLAHTATTHGLLELPVQSDVVQPGTTLRFLPWP